jgi:hypothetical protein
MIVRHVVARGACLLVAIWLTWPAAGQELCRGYGPQTPRDIASTDGRNGRLFAPAPPAARLDLCNIHAHRHAEHKGPGFTILAGEGEGGGFRCNDTGALTAAELTDPTGGHGAFHGVAPGDTIEVHWVYSSCDVAPGPTLRACLSDACANPQLRVEAQVFLLVNDPAALDFADYVYAGDVVGGHHQPKALPTGTGDPVTFPGSTTGPAYSAAICSPLQVTWSVRPDCARLDIGSLHAWAASGNVFEESHAHGVRPLVTAPELLALIE